MNCQADNARGLGGDGAGAGTPILLLDLLSDLNAQGRTIVAVLHDLNQACRYASHLVAMKDGAVVASGLPNDIVTADFVSTVFGLCGRHT